MSARCSCNEGKIEYRNGQPVLRNELYAHNCDYIDWRNSLIPRAERLADELYSRVREYGKWSVEFHHRMNKLVKDGENQ
jgi:hypothetical protein